MDYSEYYLQFAAQLFVVGLNGLMLVPLVLGWKHNRKPYLALVCIAGVMEISRQVPNALLVAQESSIGLFVASLSLQFFASVIFLAALFRIHDKIGKRGWAALVLPSAAFLTVITSMVTAGLPGEQGQWIIASLPMTAVSVLIFVQSWKVRQGMSAGKLFLIASTYALLVLRVYVPFLEESDLFFLLYYLENLLFPLLLASVTVLELEYANQHIARLHAERKQSAQELQFIVDNALDVILMTDEVGLLRNWNKPAEAIFGYSESQTVGTMHIDELFVDKDWRKRLDDYAEFNSRIEHLEGGVHDVHVRMQSVIGKQETNMVFMIRDISAMAHLTDGSLLTPS